MELSFVKYLNEAALPTSKALKVVEKFIKSMEEQQVRISNGTTVNLYGDTWFVMNSKSYYCEDNYFKSIQKNKNLEGQIGIYLTILHNDRNQNNSTAAKISMDVRFGDQSSTSPKLYRIIDVISVASVKKAYKEICNEAKTNELVKIYMLGTMLYNAKPQSSDKTARVNHMGHGSQSTAQKIEKYKDVIDVKDLKKCFTEDEFNKAITTYWGLKSAKVSLNYRKGLMDKSGTNVETWD